MTHHPFVHAPKHRDRALMRGAASSLAALAQCRAEIFLSGHLHSWQAELHCRPTPASRSVLLVQAGTGLSTRRRESNDYNVLHVASDAVTIRRFATNGDAADYRCVGERRFVRDRHGWRA